jgi:hypothetical protein
MEDNNENEQNSKMRHLSVADGVKTRVFFSCQNMDQMKKCLRSISIRSLKKK